jgi:glycosyltransferase involved in cell wall biosynthesis
MLYYCPLESYTERYTMQWSAPNTGWLERRWLEAEVAYRRVNGVLSHERPLAEIKVGCVVDGIGRSHHCFAQIAELLDHAEAGNLTSDDTIYFDDFWHPGIEALPYVFHLLGIRPRMFAFLHAQSVDEFDFTHPMRGWMRHFEKGIAEALEGIFVCGPCLKDLVVFGGIAPASKVHVTGHPFASDEVLERMPGYYRGFLVDPKSDDWEREQTVVYSSRFDREKNPHFFIQVALKVIAEMPTAKFIICTGSANLKSSDPSALTALEWAREKHPENIIVNDGLTKEEYYSRLCNAKIQFNTADQDFVAITLLEASVAGCLPVYPYFRSFPETFLHKPGYMYERLDVTQAAHMIKMGLDLPQGFWSPAEIKKRSWIHTRFDDSWKRMLAIMNIRTNLRNGIYDYCDPYQEEPTDSRTFGAH